MEEPTQKQLIEICEKIEKYGHDSKERPGYIEIPEGVLTDEEYVMFTADIIEYTRLKKMDEFLEVHNIGGQPRWLTPAEVGKIFGVSEKTIRRWRDAGLLKTMRTLGEHTRIPSFEILFFQNARIVWKLLNEYLPYKGHPRQTEFVLEVMGKQREELRQAGEKGRRTYAAFYGDVE